jgi:hypothetical protein
MPIVERVPFSVKVSLKRFIELFDEYSNIKGFPYYKDRYNELMLEFYYDRITKACEEQGGVDFVMSPRNITKALNSIIYGRTSV